MKKFFVGFLGSKPHERHVQYFLGSLVTIMNEKTKTLIPPARKIVSVCTDFDLCRDAQVQGQTYSMVFGVGAQMQMLPRSIMLYFQGSSLSV